MKRLLHSEDGPPSGPTSQFTEPTGLGARAACESLISAMDREALVTRTRALDRVLQWNHFVIPQWHIASDRIIYWNRFGRPATIPSRGVQFDTWWVDPEKADALAKQRRRRS